VYVDSISRKFVNYISELLSSINQLNLTASYVMRLSGEVVIHKWDLLASWCVWIPDRCRENLVCLACCPDCGAHWTKIRAHDGLRMNLYCTRVACREWLANGTEPSSIVSSSCAETWAKFKHLLCYFVCRCDAYTRRFFYNVYKYFPLALELVGPLCTTYWWPLRTQLTSVSFSCCTMCALYVDFRTWDRALFVYSLVTARWTSPPLPLSLRGGWAPPLSLSQRGGRARPLSQSSLWMWCWCENWGIGRARTSASCPYVWWCSENPCDIQIIGILVIRMRVPVSNVNRCSSAHEQSLTVRCL